MGPFSCPDITEVNPLNRDLDAIEMMVATAVDASDPSAELIDCDPNLADTAAFCEAYGFLPADSANTILIASKEDPPRVVACVVLATHRLDVNGAVRRRLGARKVSFAPAELTADLTGMVMGGVTPFGLPEEIPIWIDSDVMSRERVIVGGGSRSMKVLCVPSALSALPSAEVIDDLARPIDA